jgi:hypothetical protein
MTNQIYEMKGVIGAVNPVDEHLELVFTGTLVGGRKENFSLFLTKNAINSILTHRVGDLAIVKILLNSHSEKESILCKDGSFLLASTALVYQIVADSLPRGKDIEPDQDKLNTLLSDQLKNKFLLITIIPPKSQSLTLETLAGANIHLIIHS